jgi:hypothetical protein
MKLSNDRLPGAIKTRTVWIWATLMLSAMILSACGGGEGSSSEQTPVSTAAACNPADPTTAAECGTLLIGITDADGDFLSYTVDVVSLQLEKADGSLIETLPATTRMDFAQYVNITEFISAATVPPGTYVSGTIVLDYSAAEVFVEADGASKAAIVVDSDGIPLGQTELKIVLADRDRLFISRGRASLLTVDFDLDASHSVDFISTPAIAISEAFIAAEINPVDSKEIRVRGLFIEANEDQMTYAVAIRPFHDRAGDFGRVTVHVTENTEFEVSGDAYVGSEGLRALNAAGRGTLTVAQGALNVEEREFTANIVLAGNSVPGNGMDGVKGNVIARNGNDLVVRGGTVILRDDRAFFRDDITVTVGPNTKVFKTSFDGLLSIDDISIGQNVTIRGEVTSRDEVGLHMDATEGAVRMNMTHLSGIVNTVIPGQIDIELHAIDRRRAQIFDFTGTGMSIETDADPENYEVSTGNLLMPFQAAGKPVVVYGFPNAFGAAPPDFAGRTVVDFTDVRSVLGVGWGSEGTPAPFLSISADGLLLDNHNPDIDQRHHIKNGPVLIDLTTLHAGTVIAPREAGRMLFVVKTTDSLQLYSDFADFTNALANELGAGATARSMYARGKYDVDNNIFTAYKIGIYLLEP